MSDEHDGQDSQSKSGPSAEDREAVKQAKVDVTEVRENLTETFANTLGLERGEDGKIVWPENFADTLRHQFGTVLVSTLSSFVQALEGSAKTEGAANDDAAAGKRAPALPPQTQEKIVTTVKDSFENYVHEQVSEEKAVNVTPGFIKDHGVPLMGQVLRDLATALVPGVVTFNTQKQEQAEGEEEAQKGKGVDVQVDVQKFLSALLGANIKSAGSKGGESPSDDSEA